MRQKRAITPYMFSADASVNASLSLGKIFKQCRLFGLPVKRGSRYRARMLHRRAARRTYRRVVR
jgi:hypothetical protein